VGVGGKCLSWRSVNVVQLVLVLACGKKCFLSFSLEVGQWESFPFSPRLEREGALVIHFYPDTNWEEVVCEHVEDT